ncbi:thyrotropin-releasing hormone receptor-like [Tubulanus polymorphus]|uniref:thyrotropin-releasing hormone receptor-like n=1 Tax=Tubulanus polymorphus TaxID=672921 RepID=UPI003DA6903F
MRNSTNFFLLNLSVADLFVLTICMPSALLEFHSKDIWYLGEAMCKLVPYLENLSSHASVLTILAISFERYYAICHPFQAQYNCTAERSIKVLIGVWIFAIAVSVPFIFTTELGTAKFTKTGQTVTTCRTVATTRKSRAFFTTNIALFFFIPVVILVVLYSNIILRLFNDAQQLLQGDVNSSSTLRTRRQVVYMLISIIVLFVTCMLPFRILSFYMMFTPMERIRSEVGMYGMLYLVLFSRIMYYLNSAGNFVVYNVLSTKFRDAFRKALCPRVHKTRLERRLTLSTYYSSGARHTYYEKDSDEPVSI